MLHRYRANDIWGWTDPQDGHEYAIVGLRSGISFVRVTDATTPEVLGLLLSTNNHTSGWRDMKVVNNAVYIVADSIVDHGLQVFDLARLRGLKPANPIRMFQPDFHYKSRNGEVRMLFELLSINPFVLGYYRENDED